MGGVIAMGDSKISADLPCRRRSAPQASHDESAFCKACGWEDRDPIPHGEDSVIVHPHAPKSGVLVLGKDGGGYRFFLDEKPLYCGTGLEVRWWTGQAAVWMPCRFEQDAFSPEPRPLLYVVLPGIEDREASARLTYERQLAIRWPSSAGDDRIKRYVDPLACPSCGSRRKPCGC
jgi:hypothetical protein